MADWRGVDMMEREHEDRLAAIRKELAEVTAERDKLKQFKEYVHARLDTAGVPVDPESPHRAEGCRIGGRLDHLFAEIARVHDVFRNPGENNTQTATGDSLLDRLRGIYTIPVNDGAGPLNGSDTFTRRFPTLRLNLEAADEIERLRKLVADAWEWQRGVQELPPDELADRMRAIIV